MRVSLFVMVALGAFACGGRRSIDDAIPASIADADASTHSEASAVHARASDAMVASVSGAIDANMSDSADAGLSDGIDASGPLHVTSLAAGWKHTCALLSDGPARCWGDDTSEQLGVPTSSLPLGGAGVPIPRAVPGHIVALAGGYTTGLAALDDGSLWCWGANQIFACTTGAPYPMMITPAQIGAGFSKVSAGFWYGCAIQLDATVACWGGNDKGQLGNVIDASLAEETATTVPGVQGAVAVSTNTNLTCALLTGGNLVCWGQGPLGDASGASSTSPVQDSARSPTSTCSTASTRTTLLFGSIPSPTAEASTRSATWIGFYAASTP